METHAPKRCNAIFTSHSTLIMKLKRTQPNHRRPSDKSHIGLNEDNLHPKARILNLWPSLDTLTLRMNNDIRGVG